MASASPVLGFPPLPPLPPLEPGPWALTAAAVDDWFGKAKAGDTLTYARGRGLLQSGGVRRLQELHDRGEITFKSRRIAADDFAFIAERRKADGRPSERERLAVRGRSAETDDELAALMAVLRRLAGRGLPCPTNRELGALIGGTGPDRVAYLLGLLVRGQRIRVEALARGLRVVTIAATGKRTGAGT
jgi:hypothetical protein